MSALVPCASRENRRMRNSLRSNKRMLHPVFTAMLGCAYGGVNLNPPEDGSNKARACKVLLQSIFPVEFATTVGAPRRRDTPV